MDGDCEKVRLRPNYGPKSDSQPAFNIAQRSNKIFATVLHVAAVVVLPAQFPAVLPADVFVDFHVVVFLALPVDVFAVPLSVFVAPLLAVSVIPSVSVALLVVSFLPPPVIA